VEENHGEVREALLEGIVPRGGHRLRISETGIMPERLAGLSMPSAVWRSTSFVSKASFMFRTDTGQPPHALTEAWPGWAEDLRGSA